MSQHLGDKRLIKRSKELKDKKTKVCVKLNHPEASTVFNLICTEEQMKFLQFLANMSENVAMNRYEPTLTLSQEEGICESDDFVNSSIKEAFTFDATILEEGTKCQKNM